MPADLSATLADSLRAPELASPHGMRQISKQDISSHSAPRPVDVRLEPCKQQQSSCDTQSALCPRPPGATASATSSSSLARVSALDMMRRGSSGTGVAANTPASSSEVTAATSGGGAAPGRGLAAPTSSHQHYLNLLQDDDHRSTNYRPWSPEVCASCMGSLAHVVFMGQPTASRSQQHMEELMVLGTKQWQRWRHQQQVWHQGHQKRQQRAVAASG